RSLISPQSTSRLTAVFSSAALSVCSLMAGSLTRSAGLCHGSRRRFYHFGLSISGLTGSPGLPDGNDAGTAHRPGWVFHRTATRAMVALVARALLLRCRDGA